MKARNRNEPAKGSLELVEEGFHVLRGESAATFLTYYAGTLPFVFGLLYFWAEMSRSPLASEHLAAEALGLALLFAWMKGCQAMFSRQVRARVSGQLSPPVKFSSLRRIVLSQATAQVSGLFLLPAALVLIIPFAWVYAFYQNLTALASEETAAKNGASKTALRQTLLWPGQNHLLVCLLGAFSLFVFINWCLVCFLAPGLAKTLLGIESAFTRSSVAMLNSSFFAAMCALTYLSVDPLSKVVYTLRCFYGEARRSGEDLKAELNHFRTSKFMAALSVVFIALHLPLSAFGTEPVSGPGSIPVNAAFQRSVPDPSLPWNRFSGFPATGAVAAEPPAPAVQTPELDKQIERVLQQRKYTWRMPREAAKEPAAGQKGVIGRFVDRVVEMLRRWGVGLRDALKEWLRKLATHQSRPDRASVPGYGWMFSLQILLYALIAAVVVALAVLVYRVVLDRRGQRPVVPTVPLQPTPDLADENLGADQLPEDSWTNLGRELFQRGELRLALRAFYLASLAQLASQNLISLARFKSNRDYQRELQRRAHSLPGVLSLFGENVLVFDRVWYGRHDLTSDLVNQFLARVEQMKTGGLSQSS